MNTPKIHMILILLFLAGCTAPAAAPTATITPPPSPTLTSTPVQNPPPAPTSWWNGAVFYEVFVRSFADSSSGPLANDGIGDLQGLVEKLDYLNDGDPSTTDDLGVTGLWLMPVMSSPSYHGYDITDYYTVNQEYGTNDDFKRLVIEAHQRGIKVIIDLVLNHTSSEHPWFIEARDNPGSDRRNWYIWSQDKPNYLGPWGEEVWHPSPSGYYYGIFWSGMPDLNLKNPQVTAEMENVARFWLEDAGVDGFRLDGARHLIEEGSIQENTPETHAWWKNFRTVYKGSNPQALAVGDGGVPVHGAADPGVVRGQRVGHHMGCRVGDAVEGGGRCRRSGRAAAQRIAFKGIALRKNEGQGHGGTFQAVAKERGKNKGGPPGPAAAPGGHRDSEGRSTQRRCFQLSSAASTSCTPLAPSGRVQR